MEAPAPAPDTTHVEIVPTLPASRLDLTVSVDLQPVLEDLEDAIPHAFGDIDERRAIGSNDRLEVAFEAERAPFDAELSGDTAKLSALILYRVRAWYDPPIAPEVSASCGTSEDRDDRPAAVIAVSSPLRIDRDWILRSNIVVDSVRPASDETRDACRVTALRIDATGRVMQAARDVIESEAPRIDSAVAGIDLRASFEQWWDLVRTPIPLTDSVWLVIDPIAVRRGEVTGVGHTLHATVGVTAQPRIVIGYRPLNPDRPLPPLESGDVEPGLHILVEGHLDYAALSHFLNEQFAGRSFTDRGRTIVIRGLRLSGIGGGRLALRVEFDGDAVGHVFFVGTPAFDYSAGLVSVPDLDFELASSSLLVEGLDWLRHEAFVDYIRGLARWPVDDAIRQGRRLLLDGLNRDLSNSVSLSGEVESVVPLAVFPTMRALRVQAHATASARLVVR